MSQECWYSSHLRHTDESYPCIRPSINPGGNPYNDLYGEAPPEMRNGYLFKTSGVVEIYERVEKSVSIWSVKRPKRANRRILWLWKSRDDFPVLWFIHSLKAVHWQQLKVMQSSKLGILKEVPFVNGRYWVRKGYLFSQKILCRRVRSWTSW